MLLVAEDDESLLEEDEVLSFVFDDASAGVLDFSALTLPERESLR
ncbi:hypothetical protein Areg01_24330 [Actinoplanes regularis]|nr:hypothetical protein Areg01_24330 [Actinoplanes regularis]